MPNLFGNFTATTLAGGAGGIGTSLGPADTKMFLAAGFLAAHYPTVYPFMVLLGTNVSLASGELVMATGSPGTDQLTIVRGQEGTGAATWPTTTPVQQVLTAGVLSNMLDFNVKVYGAKGDGATDDTTAIANAITAASVSGGRVYFPPGTYITQQQTIYSNVHYQGAGPGATIIQLKTTTNTDVFQGQNFNTWTGTNNRTVGVNNWSISDLTIDGNRANQTTGGCGVRVYGYCYTLRHVIIRNCYLDGMYSEWSALANVIPVGDSLEANFDDVKFHDNGHHGLNFAGPHDSTADHIIAFQNGQAGAGYAGINIQQNVNMAGGLQITNSHAWGGTQSYALRSESTVYTCNCQWESAATAQVFVTGSAAGFVSQDANFANDHIYGSTTAYGLQIGTAGIAPTGVVTRGLQFLGLTSGAVAFINDGGDCYIDGLVYQGSGTVVAGVPAATSVINLLQYGTGTGTVGLFGHLVSSGTAMTLGTLQAGMATQTVVGNEVCGLLTLTTAGAAPPAAGAVICKLVFPNTFGRTPQIFLTAANNFWFGWAGQLATGINIVTGQNLVINTSYYVSYLIVS